METGITFKGMFEAKRSLSLDVAKSIQDTFSETMKIYGSTETTITCTPDETLGGDNAVALWQWVIKNPLDPDGSFVRSKVRICRKGS